VELGIELVGEFVDGGGEQVEAAVEVVVAAVLGSGPSCLSQLAARRCRPTSATCRPHQTHSATGDPGDPLQGKGILYRSVQRTR
jgi:hypothetical protein